MPPLQRRLILASSLAVLAVATMTSARWHATAATSALSILDVLGLTGTGAACPVDCPLCECIVVVNYDGDDYDANSTAVAAATTKDVDDCAYDKSIEACASGTLVACYNLHRPAGLSASGGDATAGYASYDVAGMCDVRCAGDDDGAAEDARLCDIFQCCESCSADGAAGCFPSHPRGMEARRVRRWRRWSRRRH
jgi:hypothetical protein